MTRTTGNCNEFIALASTCGLLLLAAAASPADATGCSFVPQGEGRVAAVIDARSFRLEDGREIRLAGIEPVASEKANEKANEKAKTDHPSALAAIIAGREVTLSGEDDTPDRY